MSICIAENIKRVRDNIAEAAMKSGRSKDDIKLVAVTKTKPVEDIKQAVIAGVDAIGENRVQEMLESANMMHMKALNCIS